MAHTLRGAGPRRTAWAVGGPCLCGLQDLGLVSWSLSFLIYRNENRNGSSQGPHELYSSWR